MSDAHILTFKAGYYSGWARFLWWLPKEMHARRVVWMLIRPGGLYAGFDPVTAAANGSELRVELPFGAYRLGAVDYRKKRVRVERCTADAGMPVFP